MFKITYYNIVGRTPSEGWSKGIWYRLSINRAINMITKVR